MVVRQRHARRLRDRTASDVSPYHTARLGCADERWRHSRARRNGISCDPVSSVRPDRRVDSGSVDQFDGGSGSEGQEDLVG
jgi:hypothetical protein